jgi:hypothetical protein
MNQRRKWNCLALAGLVGVTACGLEVKGDKKTDKKVDVTEAFGNYSGSFLGRSSALSQGLGTECDVTLEIQQDPTNFQLKNLQYKCTDGTSWGFDQPMNFEMRKPSDPLQLAHDLYYAGTYVGFINYSNNYAYIGLSQVGASLTLALSQNNEGRTLEDFRVVSNDWLLFDATPAKLTKK